MAPKRKKQKKVVKGTVLRSTRRVVKETVEIAVIERDAQEDQINEDTEEIDDEPMIKTIPVEEGQRIEIPVQEPQIDAELEKSQQQEQEQEPEMAQVKEQEPEKDADQTEKSQEEEPVKDAGQMEKSQEEEQPIKDAGQTEKSQEEEPVKEAGQTEKSQEEEPVKDAGQTEKSQEEESVKEADQTEKSQEEETSEPKAKKRGRKTRSHEGKGQGRDQRKRKRSRGKGIEGEENFRRYVFRVLKQVHPELRISSMGMSIINSLMKDMFERIADEAAKLSQYSHKTTLSFREIQDAVKLVLPGELGRHAIAEGSKAVTNYMSYQPK